MGNTLAWPIVRLVQRLSMIVTLGCCGYLIFFLLTKNTDNTLPVENNTVKVNDSTLAPALSVLDIKPYVASDQSRDIFSLATIGPSGTVENTPKGQLPSHLKIVGILISNPSQIIIEDSITNKTYFIDEVNPQIGIKIVKVAPTQMTINYQGEDIFVPITKN